MRYNWVVVRLAEIDHDEMAEIVVEAWRMVVPKKVFNAYDRSARSGTGTTHDWVYRVPRSLTGETVELLQAMIRNRCVNDGTPESGYETRNADLLRSFLGGSTGSTPSTSSRRRARLARGPHRGQRSRRAEPVPDGPHRRRAGQRERLVARSVRWRAGRRRGVGQGRGRHAQPHRVDGRRLPPSGRDRLPPTGDLIYFAVADEESGSAHGMQWMADHEPDAIRADYVLTENGGLHSGPKEQPYISVNVGEKGVAWRRLACARHARPRLDAVQGRQRADDGGRRRSSASATTAHRPGSTSCGPPRSRRSASTRRPSANLLDEQRIDALSRLAAATRARARTSTPARTRRSRATPSAAAGRRG